MKKFYLLLAGLFPFFSQAQLKTVNVYSVDETPVIVPKPSARKVIGGTVISVIYDESNKINESIKGAFERACRIWEENIPTTLPIILEVKISRNSNSPFNDPNCLAR